MTASTNATRLFWGTAWTADTLLERERRMALQAQQKDGIQRLFYFTADDVRAIVPSYALHMQRILAAHGRNHPLVRSQYFGETIDAQSGMFNPARLALIISPLSKSEGFGEGQGWGSSSTSPAWTNPKSTHCMPPTSASATPAATPLPSPSSKSTSPLSQTLGHPTYHVVARHSWVGENHLAVFGKLKALAETWHPQHIVMDATGVGEGLWALLERAFPARVIPVKFTQLEKSEIGWRFLSIIETGRFRDHAHTDQVHLQYSHCICEILPGPQKTLRWGVPDGTRGPDGELIHDDFILADALTAKLDQLEWHLSLAPGIVYARDPLLKMDHYAGDNDYDRDFGFHENEHYFL